LGDEQAEERLSPRTASDAGPRPDPNANPLPGRAIRTETETGAGAGAASRSGPDPSPSPVPATTRTLIPPSQLTEDDLAAFLGLSTELFGVFDLDERLVWTNAAAAAALGYADDELHLTPIDDLVHPDDVLSARALFRQFAAGFRATGSETRWRRRDGSWRWLEWTGHLSADTDLVYGAARDVTSRHLATTTVRMDESRLQAIVDNSTSGIFVKDLDARFIVVNDAYLAPLDLQRQDIFGRTSVEIWPQYPTSEQRADADLLQGGEPLTRDDVIELADGPHTLMTVRFPLRDAGGKVLGIVGIVTDITDRTSAERELAEREHVLDTIVRSSPDIVTMLDPSGHVRELSEASERILGYEPDHPVYETTEALVHPDDLLMIREEYGRLLSLTSTSFDIRFRVRHIHGHWVTLDSRGRSIVGEDGHFVGALVMSRDVTGDLALQEELRAAVGAADRASTAKSEFLSRMSHELRTPLNSVLGFAQLLDMDNLPDEQGQAVGHILRAGRHLLNLIDEVLDIARIESGHLDLSVEPVLVLDVLGEAVDLARTLADERDIAIVVDRSSCPSGTYVLADRRRLLQVLVNLMSNAVKYNHRDGSVGVSVTQSDDQRASIAVTDTGSGIRATDIDRLFDPFDRLGAEEGSVEGTGMGLTLSKHLVERMGGEIAVHSEPAVGSTFTVVLPISAAPQTLEPDIVTTRHPSIPDVPLRILHVEDNLANLELVEQILGRHRHVDLVSAKYGRVALEEARRFRPDVILLDLHLPDMSGIDVLDRLEADPATMEIPVIVVSADATATRLDRLRARGVAAYLTKPIDVRELLRVIELVSTPTGGPT
jgi:PAS domain S-box-containing protein